MGVSGVLGSEGGDELGEGVRVGRGVVGPGWDGMDWEGRMDWGQKKKNNHVEGVSVGGGLSGHDQLAGQHRARKDAPWPQGSPSTIGHMWPMYFFSSFYFLFRLLLTSDFSCVHHL